MSDPGSMTCVILFLCKRGITHRLSCQCHQERRREKLGRRHLGLLNKDDLQSKGTGKVYEGQVVK